MKFRLIRILTVIVSFFFLTGFVPILSFIGPGVTVLTSGNIYKASAQFIINQRIEKETGKNSLTCSRSTGLSSINNMFFNPNPIFSEISFIFSNLFCQFA